MKRKQPELIYWAVAAAAIMVLVLGIWWLIWILWTYVAPQIWPTAPEALVRPGYWLFAAEWVLLGLIGRRIFGRNKTAE
jgi:hypothetical protein